MIADYYIPPKEDIKTPAMYYNVVVKKNAVLSKNKKKLEENKPTNENYETCAKTIKEIFADGFQWHDIADIMKLSIQYLNNFFYLTKEDKRQGVLAIFNIIIDITDTPYLPDYFFDPIFKKLAEQFVNIVIPDSIDDIIPAKKVSKKLSSKKVNNFITETKNSFKDGFQWEDIATLTANTLKFINQFTNTSKEEKKQTAKNIINELIEKTDIPYIPDTFVDGILKTLSGCFIDRIIDSVESLSIL